MPKFPSMYALLTHKASTLTRSVTQWCHPVLRTVEIYPVKARLIQLAPLIVRQLFSRLVDTDYSTDNTTNMFAHMPGHFSLGWALRSGSHKALKTMGVNIQWLLLSLNFTVSCEPVTTRGQHSTWNVLWGTHCPEWLTYFHPKFFFLEKMLRGEIKGVAKNELRGVHFSLRRISQRATSPSVVFVETRYS